MLENEDQQIKNQETDRTLQVDSDDDILFLEVF